ncbi:hypothetical protein, partial [Lacisediminimonas sp.]|uniref:hypothetical protein n=1 Tax=Lacisediminimonas sp. TaxID=3060582 RepID=UPI00271BE798
TTPTTPPQSLQSPTRPHHQQKSRSMTINRLNSLPNIPILAKLATKPACARPSEGEKLNTVNAFWPAAAGEGKRP